MQYLIVYKNGTLQGQTFSVPHLLATLERECIVIKVLTPQAHEMARIRADSDVYTVYRELQ